MRGFIKNKHKKLTLGIWYLTGFYRLQILMVKSSKQQKHWGNSGEETSMEATEGQYRQAMRIGREVARISAKTPWESKCLVQALTARYLLRRIGIPSTMYMGVGKDEQGAMIAHAWVRVGEMYVTGGRGEGFAVVGKYAL